MTDNNCGPVNKTRQIDATYYLDMELGWRMNDNWRFVLGGANILDEFIDPIEVERVEGAPSQVPDKALGFYMFG